MAVSRTPDSSASPPAAQQADPVLRSRLLRDRARVLTMLGCLLMLPPLAKVFALDATVAGVPVGLAYLFAVWAALIACTSLLSHHLSNAAEDESGPDIPSG